MLDKVAMRRARGGRVSRGWVLQLQSVEVPIGALSGGQRQSVAVARSVVWASKVVFHGPSRPRRSGVVQRERVLDVIKRVRDNRRVRGC